MTGFHSAGFRKALLIAVPLLVAAAALLWFLVLRPAQSPGFRLEVDGAVPASAVIAEQTGDLRVILTLDGEEIASFPFGEEHTVRVLQDNGDENVLRITEDCVYMESANCEGQDCVHMEKVTRDNLETRVMFGMIICLPHRLSAEVR